MISVILRRLAVAIPILFIITTVAFFLVSLIPGDPAIALLGTDATAEEYATVRAELGLDRPIYEQYLSWIAGVVIGDFGTSITSGAPVFDSIANRLPLTFSLALVSIAVIAVVGVTLGLASALMRPAFSKAAQLIAVIGAGLPNFWVGILLVVAFSVTLQWLPATGYVQLSDSFGGWVKSLILPVIAVALSGIASVARQTRGSVIDIASSDFVRTHLAIGTPRPVIIFKHVLRNAAIPVTTTLSFQFILVLSGAIVVETVFALPGVGQLMITSIINRDAPVAQGVVVVTAALVILVTLIVDVINAGLDPKVRHQ